MDAPFMNYQNEIYLGGLSQQRPSFPLSIPELEARAYEAMTPEARGYVEGGAGSGYTMRANRDAFDRWRIVPRMLNDVAERDLSIELFDRTYPAPVLLAPIGVQSIVHPEGELAVARAAAQVGLPMILSTAASHSIENVAEASGSGARWFQLYWPNDETLTRSFIARAEEAGYEALVVTLDTSLLAWRPADLQSAYLPFLMGQGIANYITDPTFRAALEKDPEEDMTGAVMRWVQVFSNPAYTWDDLAMIRSATDLPILLKGVLHPDDARKAVEHGMNGVIVSNHGGRQVDGSIATLDALPAVVAEVGDDFPVLVDSGVRTASDALKAVALGARAVLLGRPYIWGLTLGGEAGVIQMLRAYLAELDLTLALTGNRSLSTVGRETIQPRPAGEIGAR
ncbi:MAG: lactate 2-monooxygenase [Actinomycetota bacterium]|nr:lactate 2-monooxygenase [Actinomycetota bacterium]